MTAVACARCGVPYEVEAPRPDCAAAPGRRCSAGDGRGAAGTMAGAALADRNPVTEPLEAPGEPAESTDTPGDLADTADTAGRHAATAPDTPLESSPGELAAAELAADRSEPTDLPAGDAEDEAAAPAGIPARPDGRPAYGPGSAFHGAGSAARSYDWPGIRKRYIEGVKVEDRVEWPTLDECAAHYGAPANRVRERSAAEAWRAQRSQWQAQVEATRRQARAAALAKEGTNLDNRALDSAKLGLQLCFAKLAELGQAHQLARTAAGPGGVTAVIDSLEQTRLAQAVDLWHKVGLRAIGDPETHRIELTGVNGERLEIAQELRRDDPHRIVGVLAVLEQAGLGDVFGRDTAAAERTLEGRRGPDGTFTTDEARS